MANLNEYQEVWDRIDRRQAQERARHNFREPLERLLYAIEEGGEEEINDACRIAREALYPEGGVPPWRTLDGLPDLRDRDPGSVVGDAPGRAPSAGERGAG